MCLAKYFCFEKKLSRESDTGFVWCLSQVHVVEGMSPPFIVCEVPAPKTKLGLQQRPSSWSPWGNPRLDFCCRPGRYLPSEPMHRPGPHLQMWGPEYLIYATLSHRFFRACGFWLSAYLGVCCYYQMYFRYLSKSWMPCVVPASHEAT